MTRQFGLFKATLIAGILVSTPLFSVATAAAAPTLISTCQGLQNIVPTGEYQLSQDIDCSDTVNWNAGAGFKPINAASLQFDGNGHTINSLYINRPNEKNVGLFGISSGVTIENVRILNANVTGDTIVGILAGNLDSSTVSKVEVGGSVASNQTAGGLVGVISTGGSYDQILITGTVAAGGHAGGLSYRLGGASNLTVSNILNASTVTTSGGASEAAGIAANVYGSAISNVLNIGAINSAAYGGGIVDYAYGSTEIHNAVSTGAINTSTATSRQGALVGALEATLANSYWSIGDTGDTNAVGLNIGTVTGGGSVANKSAFYGSSTAGPFSTWNFSTIWQAHPSSMPTLRAFPVLTTITVSMPAAQVGTTYSSPQITSVDARGTVHHELVTPGSLPAGLTLDTSTGVITGIPTTAGTYAFAINTRDDLTAITKSYSIVVSALSTVATTKTPTTIATAATTAINTAVVDETAFDTPGESVASQAAVANVIATTKAAEVAKESQLTQEAEKSAANTSFIGKNWWILILVAIGVLYLINRFVRIKTEE